MAISNKHSHHRCRKCQTQLVRVTQMDTDTVGYKCPGVNQGDDIWGNRITQACGFAIVVYNGGKGVPLAKNY